jgi:hypothetical protein
LCRIIVERGDSHTSLHFLFDPAVALPDRAIAIVLSPSKEPTQARKREMICYRPGTLTSRVSSAVGLLLTLSSLLVWGAEFAPSAEWTATTASGDAFVRDVVVSSPAEEATAQARGLVLRAEDADAPPKYHRSVLTSLSLSGNTTDAPSSVGNTNSECGGLSGCINGCRSRFYKVTGGTPLNYISANTCGSDAFANQLYVWKGSGSACSTFTCTGTLAAWIVVVRFVLCARTFATFSRSVGVCERSGRYVGSGLW